MSEPPRAASLHGALARVEAVMGDATLAFAELLALLLTSGGLERAAVERALERAERTLAREGIGRTPLGQSFLPRLRAQLDAALAALGQRPS